MENDLVFCEAWHLKEFLLGPARNVRTRFAVISHNGDSNIDESIVGLLPKNLSCLFAQNVLVNDVRVIPLPIGLENRRLHYNGITSDFEMLRKSGIEKGARILSAFTVGNNPHVREKAFEDLSVTPLNDTIERMNSRAYRRIAAKYMFIASPPGNGADCHRTWEAMYLGAVPIVLASTFTEYFRNLGLPLLLVSSYREISRLGESDLADLYAQRKEQFFAAPLWMDFWVKKINSATTGNRL
jgi:hypothetical protein